MTHDIGNSLNSIWSFLYTGMARMLTELDNIRFFNISLLNFIITITILGIVLPILLTLPGKTIKSAGERVVKRK